MFLRKLKGFKYSSPLILRRFSTANPFPVKNLVDSLLYMPNSMSKVELHAKSIPILQKIKPNLHELTKDDILNLEMFTFNHDLMDQDLSDFFTRNFKNMLVSRSFSLKEFSTHLSLLQLQGEWTPEELKLITDYISLFKTEMTPNSVSQLLHACQGITFSDKSVGHLLEEKAIEFLPYMDLTQILTVATGLASRFNNSSDFWQRAENRILSRFFSLHPKQINDFCIIFLESGKGSENFWKTCNEALEAAAEDYENLKFFFPYMGKVKKGNPEFWNKYEKNILERLPKMDDLELLDHFKVLTESEKGSMEIIQTLNDALESRINNFDLYMYYLYAVTLVPFKRMIISYELWSQIAKKLMSEIQNLDEASRCRLSAELEPFEKGMSDDKPEIDYEYEGHQGEEMKEETTQTVTVDQHQQGKKDDKKPATDDKKTTNYDKKTASQDKKQTPGQEKTTSHPGKFIKKEKTEKGEHKKEQDKTNQGMASQEKKHEEPKEKKPQDKKKEFTKRSSGGKGKFEKKEKKVVHEKTPTKEESSKVEK